LQMLYFKIKFAPYSVKQWAYCDQDNAKSLFTS
jgi:hypothetical protein